MVPGLQRCLLRLPGVAIWEIFEILIQGLPMEGATFWNPSRRSSVSIAGALGIGKEISKVEKQ